MSVNESPVELQSDEEQEHLGDVIVEQESIKTHRKKVARQLNLFFHTVDKFILLLRVYPFGHPLIEHYAEYVMEQLSSYFELEPDFYIHVKATELLTEWNEAIFTREESERENFLWYIPSVDGLVSFTIEQDVTQQELVSFLSAINKSSLGQLALDDDTISTLWECDLKSISVHSVEGYLDLGENSVFGQMSEPDAKVAVMSAIISPSGEDSTKLQTIFADMEASVESDVFTKMQYKATAISGTNPMPPDALADAFRVDHSWSKDLVKEWVSGDDLEYRLIESLLSIVRTSPGHEQATQAIETIDQITNHLLDTSDYTTAVSVLKLIRSREKLFDSEEVNPLSVLISEITNPMRIEALLFQVQKYAQHRDALLKLLGLFEHDQVQTQILSLLAASNKEVRTPGALLKLLFQATNKQNELQWLASDYTEHAIYFERILPGLKGVDLSKIAIAPRLMATAMQHDTVEVRRQVLMLADPSWCTSLIIEKYIKPCMSDDDVDVRQLAVAAVRDLDLQSFEAWLAESMDFETLGFRAPSEMVFLINLYLDHDASNIATLRELITTRGWFNEKRRTLAKTVARVLIRRGDKEILTIIEQQANSLLTAPALKKEYRAMLELHTTAEPDTTQEAP